MRFCGGAASLSAPKSVFDAEWAMQQASSQLLHPKHLALSTKIEYIVTSHSIGFIVRGIGGFVKSFIDRGCFNILHFETALTKKHLYG
jgi:hypothetical protein